MSLEWDFEDKMDNVEGLFYNGIRNDGKSCHRESQFTCMDFEKMDAFLESEKHNYTNEQWSQLENHFKSIDYLSPMNSFVNKSIVKLIVSNRLEIE